MKKNIFTLLFAFALSSAYAQFTFEKIWGALKRDVLYDIAATPAAGGYIVGGTTESDTSASNAYLRKTDANGNLVWEKQYSTPQYVDRVQTVLPTADGGYIALVYLETVGSKLLKVNSTGNLQWEKTLGSIQANALIATAAGGYALTGVGDSSRTALILTDGSGTVQWKQQYGFPDQVNLPYDLVQTSDGGFAITGETNSPPTLGENDLFLLRTNAAGSVVWDHRFGSTPVLESGWSILNTPDNGFIVGGTIIDIIGSYAVPWLLRFNAAGDTLWSRAYTDYSSAVFSQIEDIAVLPDGNYALGGWTGGFTGIDAFILGANASDGSLDWARVYSPLQSNFIQAVVPSPDGEVVGAGYVIGSNTQNADFYMVKTKATVDVSAPAWSNDLHIGPNPAKAGTAWRLTRVNDKMGGNLHLMLFDLQGRLLSEQELPEGQQSSLISTPGTSGAYLLQVQSEEGGLATWRVVGID